jgi:hypothetical protein
MAYTATIVRGGAQNLEASLVGSSVRTSWDAPMDPSGLTGYRVYRNNTVVNTVSATTREFLDTNIENQTSYSYQVRAIFGTLESARTSPVVFTPLFPPMTINHTIFGNSVILQWGFPPTPHNNPRYNVRRNGVLLNENPLTSRQFSDDPPDGTFTYSVSAVYAAGESGSIDIEIVFASPIFDMEFDDSSFGDISVGSVSPQRKVKITNAGGGILRIFQMEFIGTHPNDFKFVGIDPDEDLPIAIPSDEYFEFYVTFNPTAEGDRTASLWVLQNGLEVSATVEGKGVSGLIVNPRTVDFGVVLTGATASKQVSVSSPTAGSVVQTIGLIGVYANQFALTHPSLPITLQANVAVTVNIAYNPTTMGNRPMTLEIRDRENNLFPVTIAAKSISLLPATELTMTREGTSMKLDWTAPNTTEIDAIIGSRVLQGFNIYRNNTLLRNVNYNVVTYSDATITFNNVYTYHVVALYEYDDTGEKTAAPSNTVRFVVPPANLTHSIADNNVTLTWNPGAQGHTFTYRVYRRLSSATEDVLLTANPISATEFVDASVPNGDYVYSVLAIVDGTDSEKAVVTGVTSEDDPVAQIQRTEILGNFPNPFNPETTIRFTIENQMTPVRIDIYNIRGQLIRSLLDEPKDRGFYNVVWNGRDDNNNQVGSGIYLYHFRAGEHQSTHRMLLMK